MAFSESPKSSRIRTKQDSAINAGTADAAHLLLDHGAGSSQPQVSWGTHRCWAWRKGRKIRRLWGKVLVPESCSSFHRSCFFFRYVYVINYKVDYVNIIKHKDYHIFKKGYMNNWFVLWWNAVFFAVYVFFVCVFLDRSKRCQETTRALQDALLVAAGSRCLDSLAPRLIKVSKKGVGVHSRENMFFRGQVCNHNYMGYPAGA